MAKRIFQAVVLFFAIYAFVFLPLGRKTALEHVRAIAGTPAAHQAATELQGGMKRLVHRLRDEAQRASAASDDDGDEEFAAEEVKATPPKAPPPKAPPSEPSKARPAPKPRPIELSGDSSKSSKKGPQRVTREPAASAPAHFDPSQLPDLKELDQAAR